MTPSSVSTIFETALVTDQAATAARDALATILLQTIRAMHKPGSLISTGLPPLPEHLLDVRTLSGNNRGTRTFRIVEFTNVDVRASAPELSTWDAHAIPVSEVTGKEMSGASRGVGRGATVLIRGAFCSLALDDITGVPARDRLMALVAKHHRASDA